MVTKAQPLQLVCPSLPLTHTPLTVGHASLSTGPGHRGVAGLQGRVLGRKLDLTLGLPVAACEPTGSMPPARPEQSYLA